MQVKEFMYPSLGTIPSQATILQAAEEMQKREVRALVVMSEEKPHGIVTDYDIPRQVLQDDTDMHSARRVQEVMSEEGAACFEDTDVDEAHSFMQRNGTRRLLVCNRQKQMVGVLAAEDLEEGRRRTSSAGGTTDEGGRFRPEEISPGLRRRGLEARNSQASGIWRERSDKQHASEADDGPCA